MKLGLYLLFYACILLYGATHLGIGPQEAYHIFSPNSLLHPLEIWLYRHDSHEYFVRLPIIATTLIDIILFYCIGIIYFKKESDALWSAILFSLLPAILAAGIIVNKAPFIILLTLLFLSISFSHILLGAFFALLLFFVDKSFAILFFSMMLFTLWRREFLLAFFYTLLFILSLYFYGFDVGGKPKNYFLDTFAVFAAIFSPFLFLYYFYAIYRILVKGKKDLVWFLSATPFLFSLFLSFRQKIHFEDFAPFVVIGILPMMKTFLHSYRVRIEKYRKKLKIAALFVIATLLLNDILLLFNQPLFALIPPRKHFAFSYDFPKALRDALQKYAIHCIDANKRSLQLQLRFYKIGYCKKWRLYQKPLPGGKPLDIFYRGYFLGRYYVSNSNSNGQKTF